MAPGSRGKKSTTWFPVSALCGVTIEKRRTRGRRGADAPRTKPAGYFRAAPERRQRARQLADVLPHLQRLAIQRARSDYHPKCEEPRRQVALSRTQPGEV